ncbi:unnamed protein product, partial [Choristocarpus tenellus]
MQHMSGVCSSVNLFNSEKQTHISFTRSAFYPEQSALLPTAHKCVPFISLGVLDLLIPIPILPALTPTCYAFHYFTTLQFTFFKFIVPFFFLSLLSTFFLAIVTMPSVFR